MSAQAPQSVLRLYTAPILQPPGKRTNFPFPMTMAIAKQPTCWKKSGVNQIISHLDEEEGF
jgi:hypothetical protein